MARPKRFPTNRPIELRPKTWLEDPRKRALSPEARGVLADLMVLATNSPIPGYLLDHYGFPLEDGELATILGIEKKRLKKIFKELGCAGLLLFELETRAYCLSEIYDLQYAKYGPAYPPPLPTLDWRGYEGRTRDKHGYLSSVYQLIALLRCDPNDLLVVPENHPSQTVTEGT